MKYTLAALAIVVLALLGCGTSTEEKINICDITLQNCVRVMGSDQDSKDKCYKTYHACVIQK